MQANMRKVKNNYYQQKQMASATKSLTEVPLSPSAYDIQQHRKQNVSQWGLMKKTLHQKPILNSFRWSFVSASLVSFLAFYHTGGQAIRSLAHGIVGFCVIFPIKFHFLMLKDHHRFYEQAQYTIETHTKKKKKAVGTKDDRMAEADFITNKPLSIQKSYDLKEPYSEMETMFIRRMDKRKRRYGYIGAGIGIGSGVLALLAMGKLSIVWWAKGIWLCSTGALGAAIGTYRSTHLDIEELNRWNVPGRLLEEIKYMRSSEKFDDPEAMRLKELEMQRIGQHKKMI
ncbi:hypothetical protein RFI_12521 [Reticulomyxa filosa]|uniref:Transmembrane protein n=1 Tax=Reticulomyxa filosa TaxID=46433 RepID=X6NFF6_RETFI|nr:hypothetical protein RFI_12521 [Reticulomyxa filosa]|eukprot:ETO24638.1 hypothetical protein RFI_12521 [Reticulomyxa filosa]